MWGSVLDPATGHYTPTGKPLNILNTPPGIPMWGHTLIPLPEGSTQQKMSDQTFSPR